MTSQARIVLVYERGISNTTIQELQQQLGIQTACTTQQFTASANHTDANSIILKVAVDAEFDYRLSLSAANTLKSILVVDFDAGAFLYRLRNNNNIKQSLARAIGVKKGRRPAVIDTTAGVGRDGFILATLGCRVHYVERSPVVYALLKDGLRRAANRPIHQSAISHIKLSLQDSIEYVSKCNVTNFDVIYMDPMYPQRSKSALVKQEMRSLRQIVGLDNDILNLFEATLKSGITRIVVKRPKIVGHLSARKPSFSIDGKTTRFDVYVNNSKA